MVAWSGPRHYKKTQNIPASQLTFVSLAIRQNFQHAPKNTRIDTQYSLNPISEAKNSSPDLHTDSYGFILTYFQQTIAFNAISMVATSTPALASVGCPVLSP